MIPKTLFLYWGNHKLSWLRYLTVRSFSKFNPDWQIKIYYPTELNLNFNWTSDEQKVIYEGEDWWPYLKAIPNVDLIEFDFKMLGFNGHYTEVHKSDVFRLWAIHEFGGVYSDFDILYYAPVDLKEYDLVISQHGHSSTGFIGAEAGHFLFAQLLEIARRTPTDAYQRLGPELWGEYFNNKTWHNEDAKVWNIPDELVYPYNWQQVDKIFGKTKFNQIRKDGDVPGIGLHWFGGSSLAGEWENKLNPETYAQHDVLITDLIKEIL